MIIPISPDFDSFAEEKATVHGTQAVEIKKK